MFIEVSKVIKKEKKTQDGTVVTNPHDSSRIRTEYKVEEETIRVDEIRAVRRWHKDHDQELSIDGEVTMIYLHGNKSKDSRPELLINEPYNDFVKRLGASSSPKSDAVKS